MASSISKFYLRSAPTYGGYRNIDVNRFPNLQSSQMSTVAMNTSLASSSCAGSANVMNASKGPAVYSIGQSQSTGSGYLVFCRWMSGPLAAQTISGTVLLAAALQHSSTTGITYCGAALVVWLYRPATGDKVVLYDGPALSQREFDITAGSSAVQWGTGTARTLSSTTVQEGDVLMVEYGALYSVTASRTITGYWDGTTEASITTPASYVLFSNAITMLMAGPFYDEMDGTAATALASHASDKGGAWTDRVAGWQLDGNGFVQATVANCRSTFVGGAQGALEIWDIRQVASGELRYLFRYSDASNYWYVRHLQSGGVWELHKVVATVDTLVQSAVDGWNYPTGQNLKIELTGNWIIVRLYEAYPSSPVATGELMTAQNVFPLPATYDTFNASATICGIEATTGSTSQKIGGVEFLPALTRVAAESFQKAEWFGNLMASQFSSSGSSWLWTGGVALPASAFRASKSYAIIAATMGRGYPQRLQMMHGSTVFPGSFSQVTGGSSLGWNAGAMVRYESGATPEDVAVQVGSGQFGLIQLVAICLSDLGVEGVDWTWDENLTPQYINGYVKTLDSLHPGAIAMGPIMYYEMEETAGTVAADSSGHGRDGTYVNQGGLQIGASPVCAGSTYGISLNVSGSGGGYLSGAGANMPSGNSPWTMVVAYNGDQGSMGPNYDTELLCWGTAATNEGVSLVFEGDPNRRMKVNVYGVGDVVKSGQPWVGGLNVAIVTWDGSTMTHYWWGPQYFMVDQASLSPLNIVPSVLKIGAGWTTNMAYGYIDEFMVFDRVLAQWEIRNLAKMMTPGAYTMVADQIERPIVGANDDWLVIGDVAVDWSTSASTEYRHGAHVRDRATQWPNTTPNQPQEDMCFVSTSFLFPYYDSVNDVPSQREQQFLMPLVHQMKPDSVMEVTITDAGYDGGVRSVAARLLCIRLASMADAASYRVEQVTDTVSSGVTTFVSVANVAMTPTRSRKALVIASASVIANGGQVGSPSGWVTGGVQAHRMRGNPDGAGVRSMPQYGDDLASMAIANQVQLPPVMIDVVPVVAGASRAFEFDVAAAAWTTMSQFMAAFRAPDPTWPPPGVTEAMGGLV